MFYGLNRGLCDVLSEMRTMLKLAKDSNSKNVLLSLIEEAQVMGNRMEAALYDIKDLKKLHDDIKDKKEELKKLKRKVKCSEN